MGAVSFPILAVAENWGTDATLAITVKVVDELTGSFHTAETWVETRGIFPGEDSDPVEPAPAPAGGKGPSGTVRFVQPQMGQTVAASSFPIKALGETWGVDSNLLIEVEVRNIVTGQNSYASCRCNTHPPFPGQIGQDSF